MKIYLIIAIFILMNVFFIISNEDLALKDEGNLKKVISLYFDWVSNIINNLGTISGNAIDLNWVPTNEEIE